MGSLLCVGTQDIRRPRSGGQRSVAGSLRALAEAGEEVIYLIPHAEEFDERLASGLRVCSVAAPPREGAGALWRSLRMNLPYKFAKYHSRALLRRAEALARQSKCDWALLHCPHVGAVGVALKARLDVPVFLREHNLEYRLLAMYREHAPWWQRPALRWQERRTMKAERTLWRTLDGVFMISDGDHAEARRHAERAHLVYDGVAPSEAESAPPPSGSFLLSAGLDAWQNRRALRWFAHQVWLPFAQTRPQGQVRLSLIGAAPERLIAAADLSPPQLRRLSVEALGFAEDFGAEVRRHAFFVSATLHGSGYRVKIAEAGAAGACLLLTPTDLRSLAFLDDGKNCRCFADAEGFAAVADALLDDEDARRRLAESLRDALRNHMSWSAHADAMLRAAAAAR